MVKFLSYPNIEKEAEKFLNRYHPNPSKKIPVPIEEIVDLKLKINIVSREGLLSELGIDAFLSHDFKDLYIDREHYESDSNRSHFTLAHEVGHYILHKYVASSIKTEEEWKRFIFEQSDNRRFYEVQANHFAGCLLMPKQEILSEFNKQKKIAKQKLKEAMNNIDDHILISFIAKNVARKFEVSEEACRIRLDILNK